MTNMCTINSLSEYILAIEKHQLFNCISRGENQKYEHPLYSGIYRSGLSKYVKMLDDYYLEIEPNLSELQKNNFLAFAQHHGLPTNLLDFSFSPLISLYFCIDGCKDKGYVYFISKSKTVQINKVLSGKTNGWGMLDDLLEYKPNLIESLLPGMADSFSKERLYYIDYFEKHVETLVDSIKQIRYITPNGEIDRAGCLESAIKKYKEDKYGWDVRFPNEPHTLQIYDSIPNFLKGFSNLYKEDLSIPKKFYDNFHKCRHETSGAINAAMMIFLLKHEIIQYCYYDFNMSHLEYEIEFPFYYTYRAPVIDDRIRNQQSVFVFQPFSIKKAYKDRKDVYIWQVIKPDFIIEVNNPDAIKKELDAIGINLKTIYCDFDSVAKYIKATNT